MTDTATAGAPDKVQIPHVIKGRTVTGGQYDHGLFATPELAIDELVWERAEPGPAFDTPIRDIVDFLVEVGHRLDLDSNGYLAEALEHSLEFNTLERRILENTYRAIPFFFDRDVLEFQIANDVGWDAIDGWAPIERPHSLPPARVRAFPPRLAHIMAGNTPAVAVTTIARGALTKGVHLLKVPANDPLTAGAILRTMADVDPDHPTTRSFSAVYWRGGDARVESAVFRPQFFDKLVVWGGGSAIENAYRYAGPGFEIVAFDPKVSISFLGVEAYRSEETIRTAARHAAADISLFNQDACAASRFVYAEGDTDDIDRFCEALADELKAERPLSSAKAAPIGGEVRDEVEVLRGLEPWYRVWGDYSGAGLVIRSEDPVDFYPTSKTVNVVAVPSLDAAIKHANIATQTVGVYPAERIAGLRDRLASMGVQRVVDLGGVASAIEGLPHDGFYPLRRVMRWVLDDSPESR
ncbi:acyl-CoA reductase [Gordonia sp. NPDC003425]